MDAKDSVGQPRVLISRTALLHNIHVIRGAVGTQVLICAMVKANAYGHGAEIVADTLTNFASGPTEAPAVDALAVVTLDEAEAIGPTVVPTLVLRPVENVYIGKERERLEMAIRNGWSLTVGSVAAVSDLARLSVAAGRRTPVQVMIDTGSAREGTAIDKLSQVMAAIESRASLRLNGLCTHFVSSEEADNPFTDVQLQEYLAATDVYAARNPKVLRHAANSGAIFFKPQAHLDMVRPGISIFGIDPTCQPSVQRPLRPVLRWVAPVLMMRDLPIGATVGYNQTWQATRPTRLGLVPVGYADGYQRSFSNRAVMMIHGKPAPVVGRVSMDYTTIDLTEVPQATVGDEVTVLDSDPLSPASVYNLAQIAQTIPYELFCHIGQRVRRVAVEPGDHEDSMALKRMVLRR